VWIDVDGVRVIFRYLLLLAWLRAWDCFTKEFAWVGITEWVDFCLGRDMLMGTDRGCILVRT